MKSHKFYQRFLLRLNRFAFTPAYWLYVCYLKMVYVQMHQIRSHLRLRISRISQAHTHTHYHFHFDVLLHSTWPECSAMQCDALSQSDIWVRWILTDHINSMLCFYVNSFHFNLSLSLSLLHIGVEQLPLSLNHKKNPHRSMHLCIRKIANTPSKFGYKCIHSTHCG